MQHHHRKLGFLSSRTFIPGFRVFHIIWLLLLLMFGAGVALALWFGFKSVQDNETSTAFNSRSRSTTFLLQTLLDEAVTSIQSFKGVYDLYPTLDPTVITQYLTVLQPTSSFTGGQLLSFWLLPLVPLSQEASFVLAARQYYPDFNISAFDDQTTDENAPVYPLYFIGSNSPFPNGTLGLNLYSVPTFKTYIDTAITSQQIVVAPPMQIAGIYFNEVMAIVPLFWTNRSTSELNELGVAVGLIDFDILLAVILARVPDSAELNLKIFYNNAILGDSDGTPSDPDDIKPNKGLRYESAISGPNFNWTLVITPENSFINLYRTPWSGVLVAIICAFVVAIAGFFMFQVYNHQRLKRMSLMNKNLLDRILPPAISARVLNEETFIADDRANTTVLFMDISGFTSFASKLPAIEVVITLDALFTTLDKLATHYDVVRIKTIGDSYMAVTGVLDLPGETAINNAERMVAFALAALPAINGIFSQKPATANLRVRMGIHSGPVVSGVTGQAKPHFDIWGDSVNTASRMESTGVPNRIQISEQTYQLVKGTYVCTPRPDGVEAKGLGNLPAYLLEYKRGEEAGPSAAPPISVPNVVSASASASLTTRRRSLAPRFSLRNGRLPVNGSNTNVTANPSMTPAPMSPSLASGSRM